jgi:7,8-dihydro-6-hydroxymethylpterin dimethyltransferase
LVDALILEESDRIVMRKTCAKHGRFEDVLSTNPAFFRRMESLYFGHDFACAGHTNVHDHGPSTVRTGRGVALIIDLTNRCNLKCSPCFMDANHTTYVHELSMDDVRQIFDRARSVKPQRELNVLFAGGEPTIASNFLDAVRYAKRVGFNRICVVTNGIRFAQEDGFAARAHAAGVHQVYLQLDGTTNESHRHRGAGNLFDVKRLALQNISSAGMQANLQVTVMNGVNNDAVGDIVRFAVMNIEKIRSVLFQPIMFTGRDASASEDDRWNRRYTFADLADDLRRQMDSAQWEPLRDWFPMSAYSIVGNLFDHLDPTASIGSMFADAHPSQAVFSPLLVNQRTRHVVPLASFFNLERLLADLVQLADQGRGPALIKTRLPLAILRNFNARRAPAGVGPADLARLFEQLLPRFRSEAADWHVKDNADPEWRLLMVAGMWFQDLFNFDFDVIGMDPARVGTVEGEISFCAHNSAGWRRVLEHVHKTASLGEWHRTHGRHPIYANGTIVPLQLVAATRDLASAPRTEAGK